MDLRHFRYAVALAEELHFTRAAARLGIAQPPLSQRIKELELELGVQLFHRLTRGVEITKAGEAFLPFARNALQAAVNAREAAQRAARGELGAISIGFTGSSAFNPLVPRIISAFREAYPDVRISLVERTTAAMVAGMEAGTIDVAFLRPALGETDGLSVQRLPDEDLWIALPPWHKLAQAKRLRLADLAGDPFVLHPRSNGRQLYDSIITACRDAGFSPHIVQEAPQMTSTVSLVAAGVGVALVTASMRQLHAEGVAYAQIVGKCPKAMLMVAHRREGLIAPAIRNFMHLATKECATPSSVTPPQLLQNWDE